MVEAGGAIVPVRHRESEINMAGGIINLVRIIEQRPVGVTIRRWREIRHATMLAMGMHWHKNMLPLHFNSNAGSVYHYDIRTQRYEKRKAWFRAKGADLSHDAILKETRDSMPKGLKAARGFNEDVFWRKFNETRDRMLAAAGAPREPLVYTGTLKRNVTQVATVRSFEQRFKLVMPGTSYTPSRPMRPNQPWISDEVTRLLEREKTELSKIGKAVAVAAINKNAPQTVSIS